MNLKQWRLTQQVGTPEGGKRTMTQADAARLVGTTRAQWFNWESGKRMPESSSWERIWAAMGLRHSPRLPTFETHRREILRDSTMTAQRKVYDARHATSKRKGR